MKTEKVTKGKKLFTLVLSLLMFLTIVMGVSVGQAVNTVAEAASTNKSIMLGTSGLSGPTGYTTNSYVYFGNESRKWQVLATKTNNGADSGIFLLSASSVERAEFGALHVTTNSYQGSLAQTWCTNFANNKFSQAERDAMLGVAKSENVTLYNYTWTSQLTTNDKLFYISAEELNTYVGSYGAAAWGAASDPNGWWLRSGTNYNGVVLFSVVRPSDKTVQTSSLRPGDTYARPAMNLNKSNILFVSAATGGKSTTTGLTKIGSYTGNEWKTTILDSNRKFKVTETEAVGSAGYSVDLSYSDGTTKDYISAMILNSAGEAVYYGRVSSLTSASGTVSVTLPSDLANGNYTLKMFSEQCNGDKKTDYASAFSTVALTVVDPTEAKIDTTGDEYLTLEAALTAASGNDTEDTIEIIKNSITPVTDATLGKGDSIKSYQRDASASVNKTKAKVASTLTVDADGNATFTSGEIEAISGTTIFSAGVKATGASGVAITNPDGNTTNISVTIADTGKDTVMIPAGGKVEIGNVTYENTDTVAAYIDVTASDNTLTNGTVKLGNGASVIFGNETITAVDGDIRVVADTTNTKDIIEIANVGGEVTIGDTTYTAGSEHTKITVDGDGNVTLTNGTATISGNSDITTNENTYTTGGKGATVTPDGVLTDGSVKFGKDDNVKVGNNTITNVGDNTVEVDKDGNVTIPSSGEVTIGDTTYTSETDGTVITVDKDGKVSVTEGTASIPSGKEIKVGGSTYTAGETGATVTSDGEITDGSVLFGKDCSVKIGDRTVINVGDNTAVVAKDGNVTIPGSGKVTIGGTDNTIENSGDANSQITLATKNGKDYITVPADGTIKICDKEYSVNDGETIYVMDEGSSVPNVIVSGAGLIDSSAELVVTKEEKVPEEIQSAVKRDELSSVTYGISFIKGDMNVQPDGKLTIRLLIPEEGKERGFRIVHLYDGTVTDVEYTIDDDYAVFTADNPSEFSFIIDNGGSAWWLILILAIIVAAGIVLIVLKKIKDKKDLKDGTCLAAAAFGGVIPIPEIVFIVLLGIAAVAIGVYLVYLYVKAKKAHRAEIADNATASVITENAQEPTAEQELATAQKATEAEEHSAEEEAKDGILARFNYSLTAKLILSSEETKENFAEIANYLLSYKNVKSRMSWKNLSFNHGRKCLAKIAMRGKTLWLYLALDPKEFIESNYHGEDFSDTAKYAKVPYAVKIKSEHGLKHAKELVDILMSRFNIERGTESNSISASDYAEDTQANLIKRGIIKVYSDQETAETKLNKAKFDIRGSVRADEAKKLLDDAVAKNLLVKEESSSVKKNGAIVNIDTLSAYFTAGDTITLSVLKEKGLVAKKEKAVKILARGTIDKPLTVVADSFSADAIKMLVLTGGKAVIGNR